METKNEYNFTEIGKIPVEWDIARMESIGSTYGGLSGKTKDDFEEGNQNFVSYRQIFSNPLLKNQNFETVYVSEKEKQNEVEYGDVLFTTSSETPDEVAMSSVFLIEGPEKHFLNSFSFGYRFNNLQVIDPRYYGYYFRGDYFRKLTFKLAQGSTRYNISKNKLIEEVIHIPPLKEQQKIAEIISTVDEQIEQTNQLIEKTTELKKGLMQQLLTRGIGHTEFKKTELGEIPVNWNIVLLKKIGSFLKGKGIAKKDLSSTGAKCILYGQLYTTYNEIITEVSTYTDIYIKNPVMGKINDLLIPSSGETPIDIATSSSLHVDNVYLGGDINIFRPSSPINSDFLSYQINSIRKYELSKKAQGSSIYHLYKNHLENFKVIVPELEEQNRIVEIITTVDEEISEYKKEKAKYEELKKGLMQQLLTGKKRVKV